MPHLICVGAQRAGTTFIYDNLNKLLHDRCSSVIKEVQYFNTKYIASHKNWSVHHRKRQIYQKLGYLTSRYSYKNIISTPKLSKIFNSLVSTYDNSTFDDQCYINKIAFGLKDDSCITMDFTPEYSLLDLRDFRSLYEVVPDSYFLFITRNPIPRAFSHLCKLQKEGKIKNLDFSTINNILKLWPDIVQRSNYSCVHNNLLSVVSNSRLMIIDHHQIADNSHEVVTSIASWLANGLNLPQKPSKPLKPVHSLSKKFRSNHSDNSQLRDLFLNQFSACYDEYRSINPDIVRLWESQLDDFFEAFL